MFSTQQEYAPLSNEQDAVTDSEKRASLSLLGDSTEQSFANYHRNPNARTLLAAYVLFALSSLLCIVSGVLVLRVNSNANNSLLKRTSYYSPMFDKIDIGISTVRVNGSFLNTKPPSIYRQDPSPEVDAAWLRISDQRTIAISSDEVRRLGKDPSKTSMYPVESGLGPDAHVAALDVFHLIHCLNMVRKQIHFDYYYAGQPTTANFTRQQNVHVSHCIHLLLQNIMCDASVDVITHRWVDVQQYPIPDFSLNKQCRDFDAVLEYQQNHWSDYRTFRKPVNVIPDKAPDEFKDLFQQWQYVHNDMEHFDG